MSTETSPAASALDPVSRISEILFGLVMVLTFTGTLGVTAGREDVREMLLGALGCNLIWGVIDALLFLMSTYTGRGRNVHLLKKLRRTKDTAEADALILDAMPEKLAELSTPAHIEHLRKGLLAIDPEKLSGRLTWSELRAAFFIFALVFIAVFPVTIPFLIFSNVPVALRVSNAIAIGMLVASGVALARYTGGRPLVWGSVTAAIGTVIVWLTIALGG